MGLGSNPQSRPIAGAPGCAEPRTRPASRRRASRGSRAPANERLPAPGRPRSRRLVERRATPGPPNRATPVRGARDPVRQRERSAVERSVSHSAPVAAGSRLRSAVHWPRESPVEIDQDRPPAGSRMHLAPPLPHRQRVAGIGRGGSRPLSRCRPVTRSQPSPGGASGRVDGVVTGGSGAQADRDDADRPPELPRISATHLTSIMVSAGFSQRRPRPATGRSARAARGGRRKRPARRRRPRGSRLRRRPGEPADVLGGEQVLHRQLQLGRRGGQGLADAGQPGGGLRVLARPDPGLRRSVGGRCMGGSSVSVSCSTRPIAASQSASNRWPGAGRRPAPAAERRGPGSAASPAR